MSGRLYPDMKFVLSGSAALAAVCLSGCAVTLDSQSQISREEKRFPASGKVEVRVTTFDGSIQIQSWDKPEVLVVIEKRGPTRESVDALEVRSEQQGNVIEVEVKKPRRETLGGFGFNRTASARFIVTLPRRTDVRAKSGDGSIRIDAISGRIDLHTGDGSIRANDVSGDLTLTTGGGSVIVDRAEGRLSVDTGD